MKSEVACGRNVSIRPEKKKKILEILLRHAVPPTLIDNVHTREHDLDGDDDGDEHAHFGRRGGDDCQEEKG